MRFKTLLVSCVLFASCGKSADKNANTKSVGSSAVEKIARYEKATQSLEFDLQLKAMADGATIYYNEDRVDHSGMGILPKSLPNSVPLTPSEVTCDKKPGTLNWDAFADLRFLIAKPFLGHYEFVKVSDTKAKAVAKFDTDCDGKIGEKSITIDIVNGSPRLGAVTVEQED